VGKVEVVLVDTEHLVGVLRQLQQVVVLQIEVAAVVVLSINKLKVVHHLMVVQVLVKVKVVKE
jgi:hypothetical protein